MIFGPETGFYLYSSIQVIFDYTSERYRYPTGCSHLIQNALQPMRTDEYTPTIEWAITKLESLDRQILERATLEDTCKTFVSGANYS